MKKMHKRVLALLMALVLMFSCTAFASAAAPESTTTTNQIIGVVSEVSPRNSYLKAGGGGLTPTSSVTKTFAVNNIPERMSLTVRVGRDCFCVFRIKDSNGNLLGTCSIDFQNGVTSATVTPTPAVLSQGRYSCEIWFDQAGIVYEWSLYGSK